MNRMQKWAGAVVFCVCLGVPVSAIPQETVTGCPAGMICLTQQQAAAIVARFNQMQAVLQQAAAMIEERDKALAEAKLKSGCS